MKKIKLTQNKYTLIDDSDWEWLNQWKWCFMKGYAIRGNWGRGHIYMHREIINTPKDMETDHINGDKLDNRRSNLRIVTHAQNNMNVPPKSNNTSGFKGVTWNRHANKWKAYIFIRGKQIHLGYFNYKQHAQLARKFAERLYFKDFRWGGGEKIV